MKDKIKKDIMKEYANKRIDEGDRALALEEIEFFLNYLNETILQEILKELKK